MREPCMEAVFSHVRRVLMENPATTLTRSRLYPFRGSRIRNEVIARSERVRHWPAVRRKNTNVPSVRRTKLSSPTATGLKTGYVPC
jgi:hypothetical protein